MNDAVVLNIGTISDDDRTEIGADGNTGRNQTFMADFDISN